jgi:hypothetical protein
MRAEYLARHILAVVRGEQCGGHCRRCSVNYFPSSLQRANAASESHGLGLACLDCPECSRKIESAIDRLLADEGGDKRVEQLIRLITTRNYENRTPERMRAYAVELGLIRRSTRSRGRGGRTS